MKDLSHISERHEFVSYPVVTEFTYLLTY